VDVYAQTVFSARAIRDFRNLRKAQNELVPVLKKLKDLRRGNWSPSNAKQLTNRDGTTAKCRVPMYEIQVKAVPVSHPSYASAFH
jgi:hypothetical protein